MLRSSRLRYGVLLLAIVAGPVSVGSQSSAAIDPLLHPRLSLVEGESRIILTAASGVSADALELLVQLAGGTVGRRLPLIDGVAATVPNSGLVLLANSPIIQHLASDRAVAATMERTSKTTGAAAIRSDLGLDGSGIGIAVIDSGVTSWHDDLADPAVAASQRIDAFVDFVGERPAPYDDLGHGTHVAGIIAGNGIDSDGLRSGIAPAARLTVLKVLNASGQGRISDVIAAFDYAVTHRTELNIRLINVSIGAGIYESYTRDPLTLAAKRAVDAGIVVVAAAGNRGRSQSGASQYGGITAPGNAPWVVTVGASSHMGTLDRADDTVAAFSSRGPTAIDRSPKPDLVAPGVGIESLSAPDSALFNSLSNYLLTGTSAAPSHPYLSLSGTSMSAPVVTGTIALMLQANPTLTPIAVKAMLQYTAQPSTAYDVLAQGAGFLNARGAVELARYFADGSGASYPSTNIWSKRLIWGTGRTVLRQWPSGMGPLLPGAASPMPGFDVLLCVFDCGADLAAWREWGRRCLRSGCDPLDPPFFVWNTPRPPTMVGGTFDDGETVVWGTDDAGEMVVWGTEHDGEMVVWGTTGDNGEMVVWGTTGDDGEMVVWGTGCDNDPSCQPAVGPGHQ